jgi:hypothetical protein
MSVNKYGVLVSLLIEKTDQGTAGWETTTREGVFSLSLPDYSILISQVPNEEGPEQDVRFQIVDAEGTVIDFFRDLDAAADVSDKTVAYRAMEKLYGDARRSALGVDKALDALIAELSKR